MTKYLIFEYIEGSTVPNVITFPAGSWPTGGDRNGVLTYDKKENADETAKKLKEAKPRHTYEVLMAQPA